MLVTGIFNLSLKSRFRPSPVPFAERGGRVRGVVDLLTGCYPGFLFGGSIKDILPVFHFHDISRNELEPYFRYLAENNYRAVTSEAISSFVRHGKHPGPNTVSLCFDDAWSSLWTVVGPLLREYGLTAITYAIPSRIIEAGETRPTIDANRKDHAGVDSSAIPFVTWPELRALQDSGLIDVQCHTDSHSSIFYSDRIIGFVTPDYQKVALLSRPSISSRGDLSFLGPRDLGAPLYPQRSRMSNALRFIEDGEIRLQCMELVSSAGGEVFFARPDWKRELEDLASRSGEANYESADQRDRAIQHELGRGREVLCEKLKTDTIRHLCFPWGIAGEEARDLAEKVGYRTAFSDRLFGRRAVRYGDNPYQLMRLKYQYIFCLPGSQRRSVFDLKPFRSPPSTS